jgi:uncharacterized membrane protein
MQLRTMTRVLVTLTVAGGLATVSQSVATAGGAPHFTFVSIDAPEEGAGSYAEAISDSGQVAGTWNDGENDRPFYWTKKRGSVRLSLPGGAEGGYSGGINAAGQMVGGGYLGEHEATGVLFEPGRRPVDIGQPSGYSQAYPEDINDKELVTATVIDDDDRAHPAFWKRGRSGGGWTVISRITGNLGSVNRRGQAIGHTADYGFIAEGTKVTKLVPPAGWDYCIPNDINNRGEVTGELRKTLSQDRYTLAAFVRSADGAFTQLPSLPTGAGFGAAMNERGEVVGAVLTADGRRAAYWRRNGAGVWKVYDLTEQTRERRGRALSGATDINEKGQVVGFTIEDDRTHGFLLNPR